VNAPEPTRVVELTQVAPDRVGRDVELGGQIGG